MNIEKTIKAVRSIIFLAIFLTVSAIAYVAYRVHDEGGIKQAVINAGKEIKDISSEIEAYQPDD